MQMSPVYVDTLLNRSVTQVACGARHTVFLFWDGKVASVGGNNKGQLGIDSRNDVVCPSNVTDLQNNFIICIGCGNSHTLAADGEYSIWQAYNLLFFSTFFLYLSGAWLPIKLLSPGLQAFGKGC